MSLKLSLLCTATVHLSLYSVAHSPHVDHNIFQTQAKIYRCDETELNGQISVLTTNCKFYLYTFSIHSVYVGRDSGDGIATRYGLDGPGIESR